MKSADVTLGDQHKGGFVVSDAVDVAIVGAGPYGLSLAAHLRSAGAEVRQFGQPMHLWRAQMPRGMFLKSQGFASNLCDPHGTHTLAVFCRATGRSYADYGQPVRLDDFVAYGDWFAGELANGLETTLVTGLTSGAGQFELRLADGRTAAARRVVLATGVEHFAHVPPILSAHELVRHSSTITDPAAFADMRVAIIGRGQSALESAALLSENGAAVEVITRSPAVAWNGPPLLPDRPLRKRLREPEAGLGSGWSTWFYSNHPDLFRHLPEQTRIHRARTALGPAGAAWLRPRIEGRVPVRTSERVDQVRDSADGVTVALVSRDGERSEVRADCVIAATGYRPGLQRLAFLDDALRARIRTVAGTAAVDAAYQTSVDGLYVIGPAVAPVFGPVMRFVYGTAHAARTVSRHLAATAGSTTAAPARPLAGMASK
ncbi:MAG TPA: FAD-dependent oxidoreductase [Streptosporangiaceae bacterium]|jgi:thioredoxin reductase|nr:FAD-dependent oxidoreductase [Streptosporangiaceae bacterium]